MHFYVTISFYCSGPLSICLLGSEMCESEVTVLSVALS